MKRILTLFVFLYACTFLNGQSDTLFRSFVHQDSVRGYILYVPEAYDGSEAWPLVLNIHGYALDAFFQMVFSDMNPVADTAHFLVAYPQGTPIISTVPNVPPEGLGFVIGGEGDNSFVSPTNVDDVDFMSKVIDHIDGDFNVDLSRVYSTGFSNGGFLSTILANELSDRIAAIAPLSGTIPKSRPFEPVRAVPALYIFGTADPISPYEGNEFSRPVEETLEVWINKNGCDSEPILTPLPDIVSADSSTVERLEWQNCEAELAHLRITNGGHQWFGGVNLLPFLGFFNQDINASSEIWNFFSRQSLPPFLGTADNIREFEAVRIFPNPASTQTQLRLDMSEAASVQISLQTLTGEVVLQQNTGVLPLGHNEINLDLSAVSNGSYFLTLLSTDRVLTLPLIVSKGG
ncbi:MAG: T9SS type A sorting domain-containing protein [Bacteroidota bacterium]